ncbi:MAG: right-handed parallel beta-helix repeat-containing protein [Candidatus Babeliales bacterium]
MNCIHKFFAIIMAGLMACSVQAVDNNRFSKMSNDQLQELIVTAYQEMKELEILPDTSSVLHVCYQNIMHGMCVERSMLEEVCSFLVSDAVRSCFDNSCSKLAFVLNLLCEINEDITGIFTVIDNISIITLTFDVTLGATVDLSSVLTVLAFDFYDTQTVVCQKFEETWTILQKIDDDLTTLIKDISSVFTAVAFGFYDTQTIICEKFEQTWTIIASVAAALCSPQEILQANIGVTTYTISQPGFYVFAENIVFSPASGQPALEITSDNVTIDMCGKTLTQGNAVAGVDGIRIPGNTTLAPRSNVTIMNGAVSGFTRSGIVVGTNPITPANTAARLITIKDMKIFSCSSVGVEFVSGSNITGASLENLELLSNLIGASLTNVVDSSITSCDMTLNTTGIRLNLSSDIVIEKCRAHENTQAGFWLQNSNNNTLTKCLAINNGQGGSTNAYGFIAQGGFANVFEECIAQGTLSNATGDDDIAAGFALTSTEMCSKIINCESLTNTTVSGFAIPYGILLTNTFPGTGLTLSVTQGIVTVPTCLNWSPDGKYLAVGNSNGASSTLFVFRFDPVAKTLAFLSSPAAAHGGIVTSVSWSPDGRFIALGGVPPGGVPGGVTIRTYSFNAAAGTVTLIDSESTSRQSVRSVSWSPTGRYLLAGQDSTTTGVPGGINLRVYRSNGGSLTLVRSSAFSTGAQAVFSVDWLNDQKFAVGGVVDAGISIGVFRFNPMTNAVTSLSSASPGIQINGVRWSPDKRYLAACGTGAGTNIFIYPFDGTTLGTPATATFGATASSLDWSPDGKYIGVGGTAARGIRVYRFSRTLFSLSSPSIVLFGGGGITFEGVEWSPSGEFFVSSNQILITVYSALVFSAIRNLVKNNVVYCNNGDSLPSGLGISGSSFSNMIIGNQAYNNQFNYEFVTNVYKGGINGGSSILENISVAPY